MKQAIDLKQINNNALRVIEQLTEHGFQAYLVGGCVRDLLLGMHPKDFDIATNAKPEEIRKVFRNCRLIGRRFRLAHVRFGRQIIEVATFRGKKKQSRHHETSDSGMILRDNVYGTLEEDAWRRDFSINALYYDTQQHRIIDYTQGLADLEQGQLRMIGDPLARYSEDPVRMLRAVRFAAKLNLTLEQQTAAPILQHQVSLAEISPSRLFEETIKLLHFGFAEKTFDLLRQYQVFRQLFPQTADFLQQDATNEALMMIRQALINTDDRVRQDKSVNPAFICAVMLWHPLRQRTQKLMTDDLTELQAQEIAMDELLDQQTNTMLIPKRFSGAMREIWRLQHRFSRRRGRRSWQLMHHKRFRAAYDFLVIRTHVEKNLEHLANWWTDFQNVDAEEQQNMVNALPNHFAKRKNKREQTHDG